MVQNIKIDEIYPNDLNPRHQLGDLTELVESIKANGVLQNLTVVEDQLRDGYIVVIGHRRLEAAKKAGLKEVPCEVVNMNVKEQLATMLMENMQRADLTRMEQSKAFQQCLDLGVTESELKAKTGFTKARIKHHLEMAKLDEKEVLKHASGSIEDYIKLEQVKDIAERNKLLQYIGTSNFDYRIEESVRKQKQAEKAAPIIALVKEFAKPMPKNLYAWDCKELAEFHNAEDVKNPSPKSKKQLYYLIEYDGAVTIYRKNNDKNESQEDNEEQKKEAAMEAERIKKLHAVLGMAKDLRKAFIGNLLASSNELTAIQKKLAISSLLEVVAAEETNDFDDETMNWQTTLEFSEMDRAEKKSAIHRYAKKYGAEKASILLVYAQLSFYANDMIDDLDSSWNSEHTISALNKMYDFLCQFDYKISDMETSIIDGSCEFYSSPKSGGDQK